MLCDMMNWMVDYNVLTVEVNRRDTHLGLWLGYLADSTSTLYQPYPISHWQIQTDNCPTRIPGYSSRGKKPWEPGP